MHYREKMCEAAALLDEVLTELDQSGAECSACHLHVQEQLPRGADGNSDRRHGCETAAVRQFIVRRSCGEGDVMDPKHCAGCRDDFYNGKNPMGIKACWLLAKAHLVRRYRTHPDAMPGSPGAFTEVVVPDCMNGNGWYYSKTLPDFVKPEDVRIG